MVAYRILGKPSVWRQWLLIQTPSAILFVGVGGIEWWFAGGKLMGAAALYEGFCSSEGK
jgi:hypothetical protein